MLRFVGKTTDGRDVVAGVFRFRETFGLPLDAIAEALLTVNVVIAWDEYEREALAAGMKLGSIRAQIEAVVSDIYGRKEK